LPLYIERGNDRKKKVMSLEVAEFAENISNPTPKNKIGRAKIWNWDKTNIKGRSS